MVAIFTGERKDLLTTTLIKIWLFPISSVLIYIPSRQLPSSCINAKLVWQPPIGLSERGVEAEGDSINAKSMDPLWVGINKQNPLFVIVADYAETRSVDFIII